MRRNSVISAAVLVAMMMIASVAAPGVSVAQPAGPGPVARVCSSDIQEFCRAYRHGRGEVRACLEHNRHRISPACRRALGTTGGGWRWR